MYSIKNRFIIFFSLLVVTAFLFSACNEDSGNNPQTVDNFDSDQYAIPDFDDAMNSIQGGTINEEFTFVQSFPGQNEFHRRPNHPFRRGSHLRQILWLLELNDTLKESVRTFVQENHECARNAFESFRTAIVPILQEANDQRLAFITQYKNGDISNQELYFALQKLRETTRTTIENDTDFQAAKQMICDCKVNLLDNIGSILDEDQLVIWNDWVSNIEGPCFE